MSTRKSLLVRSQFSTTKR